MSTPHEEFEVLNHTDQALRGGLAGAAAIAERVARTRAERDREQAAAMRDQAWQQRATGNVPVDQQRREQQTDPQAGRTEGEPTRPRDETLPEDARRPDEPAPGRTRVIVEQVTDEQAARHAAQVEAGAQREAGMQTRVLAAKRDNLDRGMSPSKASSEEEKQHRQQTWQLAQRAWSSQQPAGEGTQQAWDQLPMKTKQDLYWKHYDTEQARTVHVARPDQSGKLDRGFSPDQAASATEREHRQRAWSAARAEFAAEHPELSERQAAVAFDKLDWQDKALAYWTAYDATARHKSPSVEPEAGDAPKTAAGDREPPTPGSGETKASARPEHEPNEGISRERVLELNHAAAEWFDAQATPTSKGGVYLTERLGAEVLDDGRWQLGYAPHGWTGLTEHLRATQGATDDELVAAGLGTRSSRGNIIDTFRDRAMIGVRDVDGQTVGFVGRDLSGQARARYLNTTTTPAFTKGDNLLGLHEAPEGARLYRVEGAFDAIAITAAGDGKAAGVAPLGTALTERQADLIATHSPDRKVYLALDADEAGRRAAVKDYWLLVERGLDARDVVIPGSDPAEAWQHHRDSLRAAIEHDDVWPHVGQVVIDDLVAQGGPELTAGEAEAVGRYFDHVDAVADRAPKEEREILNAYAQATLAGATAAAAAEAGVEYVEHELVEGHTAAAVTRGDTPAPTTYDRAAASHLDQVPDQEAVRARQLSAAAFSQSTGEMLAAAHHSPSPKAPGTWVAAPQFAHTRDASHAVTRHL